MTRKIAVVMMSLLPGSAFAHGGHQSIAEPLHMLSHWGHILGALIVVGAVIAFFRQRDES